ncbi:MAG TPA: SRPBCC family protein [Jiangellaceae bacterium]|nr:SRPBCC family protein [Jiangellaceae bacterium]
MTVPMRVSRQVGVPARTAWDVLTDWERQGEWMPVTRVRVVSPGDAGGVGGRLEAWTGLGPLGFVDTMIVTGWDPPRRCVVRHTGSVVRGHGVFAVEPIDACRCRVVWQEYLDLPLGRFGRATWPVVAPLARAGLAWALRRFAAHAVQRGHSS